MKVKHFLTTSSCRRNILLDYFATDIENLPKSDEVCSISVTYNQVWTDDCCDNCSKRLKLAASGDLSVNMDELQDYTEEAYKILNVVKILGQRYGVALVVSFLLGSVIYA